MHKETGELWEKTLSLTSLNSLWRYSTQARVQEMPMAKKTAKPSATKNLPPKKPVKGGAIRPKGSTVLEE